MDRVHSIRLNDGLVLRNLGLNGSNYISEAEIKESMFTRNCSPVIISDGEIEEVHEHMELIQITVVNGEYWFALRDIPASELTVRKQQADIDYLAMMTGVEL